MTLTERDHLLASARIERATQQRKAGNLQQASDDYRAALSLLENASTDDELRLRARALQNFSNTLDDAGQHQDALSLIGAAINDLRAVTSDDAATDDDLASAYKNAANKLFNEGDYEQALEYAVQTLERYRALIGQGRSDLAEDLATLQAVHALTLERLLDIDGAISASEAAISALDRTAAGADDEIRRAAPGVLRDRLETLQDLRRSGPGDVPAWLARVRANLEIGAKLLSERAVDAAGRFFEEALTTGLYLTRVDDSDALLEIVAESGLNLAMAAYYGDRPLLAWRGGTFAIGARRRLVEQHGRRDLLDQLGGTYASVASIMVYLGRDDAAESLLAEMRECLTALDPVKAREAEQEAGRLLDQARDLRG